MNIGITTSFIIGGLLLLSILHMNFTVSSNSMQSTVQIMSKNNIEAISQTFTADVQRMGFGVAANDDIINSISQHGISFQADIDGSLQTITWTFNTSSSNEYTASANPNDYKLTRTGPVSSGNIQSIEYPVTSFELIYYDKNNQVTNNISEVDRIGVEVVCESSEAIYTRNNNNIYGRSFWQRTIVPPSLHIRNLGD